MRSQKVGDGHTETTCMARCNLHRALYTVHTLVALKLIPFNKRVDLGFDDYSTVKCWASSEWGAPCGHTSPQSPYTHCTRQCIVPSSSNVRALSSGRCPGKQRQREKGERARSGTPHLSLLCWCLLVRGGVAKGVGRQRR